MAGSQDTHEKEREMKRGGGMRQVLKGGKRLAINASHGFVLLMDSRVNGFGFKPNKTPYPHLSWDMLILNGL